MTSTGTHRRQTNLAVGAVLVTLIVMGTAPSAASMAAIRRFKARCAFSRSLPDDPIVHPGDPGASHLHDFFGNTTTDGATTTETLESGATTCKPSTDHSAYWVPSLFDDGTKVTPVKVAAYYDLNMHEPGTIAAFPLGLRMITGDGGATAAQPAAVTDWTCLPKNATRTPAGDVPTCDGVSHLLLRISFPDCWDGVNLDSADHRSHMAQSKRSKVDGYRHCPDTHPTAVPQLSLQVEYPIHGGPTVTLSSGGQFSAHADFWNAWDPAALAKNVDGCLNAVVDCA